VAIEPSEDEDEDNDDKEFFKTLKKHKS